MCPMKKRNNRVTSKGRLSRDPVIRASAADRARENFSVTPILSGARSWAAENPSLRGRVPGDLSAQQGPGGRMA